MNKLSELFSLKFLTAFCGIILLSVLFFPIFRVSNSVPGFEVIDVLIFIFGFTFIVNRKKYTDKRIYYFLAFFGIYIFFTIAFNSRLGQVRDYFEIYKLIKFGLVVGVFSLLDAGSFVKRWIKPAFVILVILNFIHYFDLFHFNDFIGRYYQAGERMSSFGLDSAGKPAFKRMLGLVCNPNYNAILFLFFVALFIPRYKEKLTIVNASWFFAALLMVFLCQSRTGLLSAFFIFVFYGIPILKKETKKVIVVGGLIVMSFLLAVVVTRVSTPPRGTEVMEEFQNGVADGELDELNNEKKGRKTYIETLLDGSAFKTYSMTGRLDIWSHMWSMVKKKPVFGHGPYKEYFYNNHLYAESQYMSILWRYGFIGLFLYLYLLFIILRDGIRNIENNTLSLTLIMATVIMIISGLTNNPFDHKTLLAMYGVIIGLFYSCKRKNQIERIATEALSICHLSTVHKPTDNRVFYKECISLHEAGHKVSLVLGNVEDEIKNGIHIYGIKRRKSRLGRILITSTITIYRKAKKLNCDVYHFHDTELIFVGILLKMRGKVVIYDVHENNPGAILSRYYVKSMTLKRLLSLSVKVVEKISANFFDFIVTARPDISLLFKRHHPKTLRNFPILPKYDEIEDLDIPKPKPAVIYVGGMTDIRGTKELITAFEELDNAELWLLGGFQSAQFEAECRALKGWKNVRYLGMVEAYEIFAYIKKADIGIITFLPVPNHVTTLATKPFEYMACGLPMIMSDFPYWRDFFKDSSLYVDPADPSAIAACITALLNNPEQMTQMSQLNRRLVEDEYNWDIEKMVLLDVYATLKTELTQ